MTRNPLRFSSFWIKAFCDNAQAPYRSSTSNTILSCPGEPPLPPLPAQAESSRTRPRRWYRQSPKGAAL